MFQLLSKQIHLFSLPVFIILLFVGIATFNFFYITQEQLLAFIISFASIFIGFFLFKGINLSYNQNLPYFLYSVFCFAFIPIDLDLFWSISFLINNLIIFIISNENEKLRLKSYFLIGSLLSIDFYLLPNSFLLLIFVILHLVFTSNSIIKNLFQLFYGIFLISICYVCIQYICNADIFTYKLIPSFSINFNEKISPLIYLSFLLLILVYSIVDHFISIKKKSPKSRYIYGIVLMYFITLCVQLFLFMENNYEYFLLLSVPYCIICSRGLIYLPKYWMKETSLLLIILSLFAFKISSYL